MTSKMEFAIHLGCKQCMKSFAKHLSSIEGIKSFDITDDNKVVIVSNLPSYELLGKIESCGSRAVLKGFKAELSAVVVMANGDGSVNGTVRFAQEAPYVCVIEGTVGGLRAGSTYVLYVHAFGDVTDGSESTGPRFEPEELRLDSGERKQYSNVGTAVATEDGRISFRTTSRLLHLKDVTGRSLVLEESDTGKGVAWGVIARSASVGEQV